MTQVILIAGYARAGKDTLAGMLQKRLPDAEIMHFADALKIATRHALHALGLDDRGDKELIRPAWIGLGRTARNLDPDVFVKIVENAVRKSVAPVVIVPDWRYANEATLFPEAHKVLLTRPAGEPLGEERESIRELVWNWQPLRVHCAEGLENLEDAADTIVAVSCASFRNGTTMYFDRGAKAFPEPTV